LAEAFIPNVLANLEAETAFLASLNDNFAKLATLLEDVLSLSGVSPNAFGAVLDMNGWRIINLPSPANPTDPVRLQDFSATTMLEWIIILPGPPSGTPGFIGQVYIDKTSWNLYQAITASAWTLIGSIQGPSGPGTGDMLNSQNLSGLTDVVAARTNLDLIIGVNVQAFDATLASLSGLSTTSFGRGLLNLANVAALETLLTLGGAAFLNVGTTSSTVAAGDDSRFYRMTPNVQNANYTLALADRGNLVQTTSASAFAWTIPPSTFSPGDIINLRAGASTGNITLTRGAGVTLTLAGSSTNKNYTLAATGAGSIICEASNTFYIVGVGIT
jgi:hypothetical protein